MSQTESRATFFRQSGWMALATVGGGVFNAFSSLIAFEMPQGQVNLFDTAQAALAIFTIPALGLQAAFAAQAAAADSPERSRALSGTMRATLFWLTVGWALIVGLCAVFQKELLSLYGLNQPALLWVLVGIVLVTLWTPVANGVLQGRQDFLWFGWGALLNGVGRFVVLALVVLGFGAGALGGLTGVLAGSAVVLALVVWRTRDLLRAAAAPVDWSGFFRRVIPLTFGLGALVTVMQADALIIREKLQPTLSTAEIVGYTAARRIGQILVFLVGAVVAVMYPKIARSFQRTEPTEVLKLTLGLTALVSILGAGATSLIPQLPLRILAGGNASPESARLVTAFVWALVPLAFSNVLAWNLLARECYRAVPAMVLVAVGFWFALRRFHDSLLMVVTVVGVSASLLMLVCAVFSFLDSRARQLSVPAKAS